MNYAKKQMAGYIAVMVIGLLIIIVALFGNLPGDLKTGILSGGIGGFLITGTVGIVMSFNLMRHPDQARKLEISKTEERNQYIRMKTHSSIFQVSLYLESMATIISLIMGQREISLTLAVLLIVQIALNIGFAIYYSKRY
ncbi:hypothetical protein CEB3_c31030 [Peptococcaceae bacterium CEB3]|nr:hypothetical protein CEB3_c31030 [Peptococcaceae bacterium CEB3]